MADRVPFLVRLDPDVMAALRRWANDDLRSLNSEIEFLLRRSLIEARRLPPSDAPRPRCRRDLIGDPSPSAWHAPGAGHYAWRMRPRISAGILMYRLAPGGLEVLLVHPGGPFFARKDLGFWSIPKGEVDPDEADFEQTARREFAEEVGHPVPDGDLIPLGSVLQKGGKTVHAWAIEGDIDTSTMSSNFIELPWPPFGKKQQWPEVDRWVYFDREEARRHIKDAQIPLLDRLESALAERRPQESRSGDAPE